MSHKDRVAIITGEGNGIGQATWEYMVQFRPYGATNGCSAGSQFFGIR